MRSESRRASRGLSLLLHDSRLGPPESGGKVAHGLVVLSLSLLPIDITCWASQPIGLSGYRASQGRHVASTGFAQHLGSQATLLFDLLWLTARSSLQEAGQGGFS